MLEKSWIVKLINLRFKYFVLLLILASCVKTSETNSQVIEEEEIVIYVTNWLELPERMKKINNEFMKLYPNIKVNYIEYINTEYANNMKFTLKAGIAADIIYLKSYDAGLELYNTGYIKRLNEVIPELSSFPSAAVKAWSSEDGEIFGVPSLGVVHGVYFNKKIFKEHNIAIPEDWGSFIDICRELKEKGVNPLAFGTADNWVLYEVLFSGLGANFYGGESTRQKVLNKDILLTDPLFVKTFDKLRELADYLPKDYKDIGYSKMREMFANEEAAMYIGGSWDISTFEKISKDISSIGYFAPPVEKKGDKLQYCFHVDIGIGINRVSRFPDATEKYIKWVASQDYAKLSMQQFPGFFSYTPGKYNLENKLAKDMEAYISESIPTVRTLWEGLSSDTPSGNELLGEAVKGLLEGDMTPEESAKYVHTGLNWFYK